MDFYRLTWREYVLMVRGFDTKRSHEFEHTRAIVYTLASIYRDPDSTMQPIHKFWPLPTDGDPDKIDLARADELYIKLQEAKKKYNV